MQWSNQAWSSMPADLTLHPAVMVCDSSIPAPSYEELLFTLLCDTHSAHCWSNVREAHSDPSGEDLGPMDEKQAESTQRLWVLTHTHTLRYERIMYHYQIAKLKGSKGVHFWVQAVCVQCNWAAVNPAACRHIIITIQVFWWWWNMGLIVFWI